MTQGRTQSVIDDLLCRVSYHLLGNHNDGLDSELAATHVEEVFKGGSKQIDTEDVVEAFLSKVKGIRNTSYSILTTIQ